MLERIKQEIARFLWNWFKLDRYAAMQTFRINASEKEITLTATLTGEEKPIEVRAKYRFEREGEKTVLVFDDVRFSREWANNLYNDFVRPEHKRVPLKWHEAAAAKMVL